MQTPVKKSLRTEGQGHTVVSGFGDKVLLSVSLLF